MGRIKDGRLSSTRGCFLFKLRSGSRAFKYKICEIKRFNLYIFGRKFILVTDHQPLIHIFDHKSNIPPLAATRQ